MPRKKNKIELPPIDGKMQPGYIYMAINSVAGETVRTKEEVRKIYKQRFGENPSAVFFGKPKGSLIYAGPIGGEK